MYSIEIWRCDTLTYHNTAVYHDTLVYLATVVQPAILVYLSCSYPYVYFQFMHVMLPLPVFILEVDRTYQSLWLTPFCFASLSSVPPPQVFREETLLFSSDFLCLKVIMDGLDFSWLWLLYCFTWGIIYKKVFMLLYYCKTGFDVLWCKRL